MHVKIFYIIKIPKNTNIQKYLWEYENLFSSNGALLFCNVCDVVKVNAEK